MKQKKIFLKIEGDRYYERNKNIFSKNLEFISKKIITYKKYGKIIEIGCGDGHLLNKIYKKKRKYSLYGIDPSSQAIKNKFNKHLKLIRGTADNIKFRNNFFDIVIFGFCLYLIDLNLLFKVMFEADRVLKKNGIIVIYDFYNNKSIFKNYAHNKSITTHKMNFSKLFLVNPNYKLIYKKVGDHENILKKSKYPDNKVALFFLQKKC
jgi:ubiquinone/menaquinone biosynthesis C-methylase UbiE